MRNLICGNKREARNMDRLKAFEAMLRGVVRQAEAEQMKMDELKRQGREKSATCRQYMGNRLMYRQILALYRQYGLLE